MPLLGACEIEEIEVPRTVPIIALHGVLSATATTQVVLLERTRSGSVASYDLVDGILGEAVAEKRAQVELTLPDGRTLQAVEDDQVTDNRGRGGGIYRLALPGDSLERDRPYRLTVHTTSGETLTAETSVPSGPVAATAQQRVFDRSRDTVIVEWPAAPGARSYYVRIETPFGPRSFFTDSTRVRLTGELRNADVDALPRVFIPGFSQAVSVSAVDSNFYDWYRTHNERISGTGVISRVQGGIGVFGALVRLRLEEMHVVVPQEMLPITVIASLPPSCCCCTSAGVPSMATVPSVGAPSGGTPPSSFEPLSPHPIVHTNKPNVRSLMRRFLQTSGHVEMSTNHRCDWSVE